MNVNTNKKIDDMYKKIGDMQNLSMCLIKDLKSIEHWHSFQRANKQHNRQHTTIVRHQSNINAHIKQTRSCTISLNIKQVLYYLNINVKLQIFDTQI